MRRPIIGDLQKIMTLFLPLALYAWTANIYRILRYGFTKERSLTLFQTVLVGTSLGPQSTRVTRPHP